MGWSFKPWIPIFLGIVLSLLFETSSPARAMFLVPGGILGIWLAWKKKEKGWISPVVIGIFQVIYSLTLFLELYY